MIGFWFQVKQKSQLEQTKSIPQLNFKRSLDKGCNQNKQDLAYDRISIVI
jgi:hypothetical protein